jgi:malto-oligosyltrehalose trehalohydrolase
MSCEGQIRTRWGPHIEADGSAVFRLWAPAAEHLRLRLRENDERVMERHDDGWFELLVADAPVGMPYHFVLPDGKAVPDPAARAQASDVHGPSVLADPAFDWRTASWKGRPWEEAVIYELHTGTFSPEGSFDGVRRRLDRLAEIGFTAIELMPVAQFAGSRGWGYDGVLPYCPHAAYGGADGLKRLIDAAHARGLMMILDVVYNHFGPDGNYLGLYAPEFFDDSRHTPWGAGIRFEERAVRDFFCDNPVYWLDEFRFDGLRLDAIDQIADDSPEHILTEMARLVRSRFPDRHVHLTTEDERNIVGLHPRDANNIPLFYSAEWNDDVHHAAHCIATGESAGYYRGFAGDPVGHLTRALAEGFCYQGEPYAPWDGTPRGVPSAGQPPAAFVDFLQNHDQVGNRALGERLTTLAGREVIDLLTAVLLLNPQVPLVFMGEEFGETRPFLFFTDFHGELASNVREGRRREFAAFGSFSDYDADGIPDPNARSTFEASELDWAQADSVAGRHRTELFRRLLALRARHIAPHLASMRSMQGEANRMGDQAFRVVWRMGDRALALYANFGTGAQPLEVDMTDFQPIYESRDGIFGEARAGALQDMSVLALIGECSEVRR